MNTPRKHEKGTPLTEYRVICDTCDLDTFGGTSLFCAKQRGFAHTPGHVWHIQAFNRTEVRS